MATLELEQLTKRYPGVISVDAIDVSVAHGEFVCLLGPSGCGKTTTLRMIAGLAQPDAGEIRVGGKVVSSTGSVVPPERRNMSMIFQSYALWPHMTVRENVAYGLKLRKVDRETVERKLAAILATTHLGELADRYPGELSGGQQQRVALARALIVEPETLLLDEPLSNLDANLREEMRFEVRRLHDEYRYTTVYVTHDQSEAMTTADVIAVMNAGKIEQAGSPEEIYDRPRSEFVARFIGSSNVIKGRAVDESHLACAGATLRCTGGKLAPGREGAIAVRQHVANLFPTKPAGLDHLLQATVTRQVFLGSSRDYMVEVADGTQVRVVASAAENIPQGASVWLHLPPEHCLVLSG